jgi:hypothetical protein
VVCRGIKLTVAIKLTAVIVVVSLAASLAFAVATVRTRPLENTEGCILFEADRIRARLPLYTDPIRGAFDYGSVPARYYVLYPPLWAFVLSLLPAGVAASGGRILSGLLWFGVIAWIGWGAYRRGRPAGLVVAGFVGGVYTLTLYGASARPDALAVGLAAMALERSVRSKSVGWVEAALFSLAVWTKPNVIGLAVGAMFSLVRAPRRALAPVLTWLVVSGMVLVAIERASGGAWWLHAVASMLQRPSLAQWVEQMSTRLPFFVLLLVFALWIGVGARREEGTRIALLALVTSIAWTIVCLAKVGSATCYWMEPALGALVVCAHGPIPFLSPRARRAALVLAPLQALWTGVGSVRSSVESILASPAKARALEEIRETRSDASLFLSDDVGIEFAIDGRLIDTPFQTTQLVRSGRFPRELWIADVRRPEIVGVVTMSDILERRLEELDPVHDRYDPDLRRVLREEFALSKEEAGFFIYRRRTLAVP